MDSTSTTIMNGTSPAEKLDAEEAARGGERAWDSVRATVVSLGKRMGVIEKDDALKPPSGSETDELNSPISESISSGVIEPPFSFEVLCALLENSNSLRQNIDGYATNIDGFGYYFDPVLDFTDPGVDDKIRDLMIRQRIDASENFSLEDLSLEQFEDLMPTVEEVENQKRLWDMQARIEKGRARSFFEGVNPLETFTAVRKAVREQLELLGNAAWEVIREDADDPTSKVKQIYFVSFINLRLIKADSKPRTVEMKVRKDPITYETRRIERYFRRYVRQHGRGKIFYKEFGDDRVVSRMTGEYFEDIKALREAEGDDAQPANELHHFRIRSAMSPYGVPRWIGALLSVLGSRASEEVNFLYFDNKAIPPMAILVSGGRLSESSVERIENYIQDRVKGRKNFHKIMVLEALPSDADVSEGDVEHSGKLRIELVPLFGSQQKDGLFQDYDQANIMKVGRAFRQPPLMTGDTRDQNRSTAEVGKSMAEEQVYQPERDSFDAGIDLLYLSSLGIRFWKFRSKAPVSRFPNDLVNNVVQSLNAGGITPNDARPLLSDAFSSDLDHIDEEWAKLPPQLAKVAARNGSQDAFDPAAGPNTLDEVEPVEGDVLARGFTKEAEDGHRHTFVATRHEGHLRLFILPAGGHSHSVKSVPFKSGQALSLETDIEKDEADHGHQIEFSTPMSKSQRRALSFARMLQEVRDAVEDGIRESQDEWLDASKFDDHEA